MAGKFWDEGPMVVTGCTKVSEACRRCWSEQAHVMRSGRPAWPSDCLTDGKFNGKVHFRIEALQAAVKGKKPKVIAPWNDLYHEGVTLEQMTQAHVLMANRFNSHHTFLIITKRIKAAADYCSGVSALSGGISLPDNIWHIATMENQARADERMPYLLQIPGKRAVIIEGMLGTVDLSEALYCSWTEGMELPYEEGYCRIGCDREDNQCDGNPSSLIHQVILGGETGTGARPMHPDWVRSVRDQCAAAGVPFFFKSWGEWLPKSHWTQEMRKGNWQRLEWGTLTEDGTYFKETSPFNGHDDDGHGGEAVMVRVGQKKAGRLLDGREHNDLAWRISA